MNAHDRQHGIDEAARARAELYQTLGQLQDRLNYARRVDEAVADARIRLSAEQRERPAAFAAGVAGVAAIAGLAVWGVVNAVMKRFG